jgi:hypothetical protein
MTHCIWSRSSVAGTRSGSSLSPVSRIIISLTVLVASDLPDHSLASRSLHRTTACASAVRPNIGGVRAPLHESALRRRLRRRRCTVHPVQPAHAAGAAARALQDLYPVATRSSPVPRSACPTPLTFGLDCYPFGVVMICASVCTLDLITCKLFSLIIYSCSITCTV